MGKGWDGRPPGNGGALASRRRAKDHLTIIQAPEDTIRNQETGKHMFERGGITQARITVEPDTRNAKLLGDDRDAGRQVRGGRGEELTVGVGA